AKDHQSYRLRHTQWKGSSTAMSALGQKQTFAVQNVMSALPPKADIRGALVHVRFVPIADIPPFTKSPAVISQSEQRLDNQSVL
ncbi:MAG: hypothetical protein WBE93_16285, partial [Pseudolabrys sp.]